MIYTPVQIKQRIASREQMHEKTGSSSSVSIIGKDIKITLNEMLDAISDVIVSQGGCVLKIGDTMSGDLSMGTATSAKLKGISQASASLGNLQYNNYIQMSNIGSTGVGMRIYSEKVLTPAHNSTSIFSPLSNSQSITDGTVLVSTVLNNSRFTATYSNGSSTAVSIEASNAGAAITYNSGSGYAFFNVLYDGFHFNMGSSDGIIKATNLTNVRTYQLPNASGILPVLTAGSTPASAASTGEKGEFRTDGIYLYLCIATNTWLRSLMATW